MTDLEATGATAPERPRIVVGVDGSEQSLHALRWGARLATALGTRLEAIAAWQYAPAFGLAYMPLAYDPAQDTEKALIDTVDEVFGPDRPVDMRVAAIEGGAAHVLLEQSKGATMLVVGSRGHGGFAGLLLGSVSASVAEHASCPVVVVHGNSVIPAETAAATSEVQS